MTDHEAGVDGFDLRLAQGCPKWCCGEDHLAEAEEDAPPSAPEHFGFAASLGGLAVEITQPLKGVNGASIRVVNGPGQMVDDLASIDARAVAAWLIRAADLVDFSAEPA